jgi:predicted alpha/beta superfamily hydrolase
MNKTQSRLTIIAKMTAVISFLIIFLALPGQGKMIDDSQGSKPPEFIMAGSQVLKINSTITGQEYVLHISLPQNYNDTNKTYPVVYLLDSQWDFPLITAVYGDQYYDGFMPSTIIVGITWGGENPNYDTRRAFDLTPTDNGQSKQFGNAEKFLSFIKKEAIPFIDSKYRTDKNNRTLAGHSFGGLFTLYALFTETELFNQYIAGSPAWSWDKASLLKYIEKFSKINLSHPVKVYAYMGEYEDVPGFEKLSVSIRGCKIKGLELETQIVKGSGHAGTKPEGYNRGLQQVFKRPSIKVDKKILEQYVGEYEINPQLHVNLELEGNQLIGIAPDSPRMPILAETEKDFSIIGSYFFIHFQKDNDGKVTGFQVEQYNNGFFAKKVK